MSGAAVLMTCGCAPQGTCSRKAGVVFDPPIPVCAVHGCLEIQTNPPSLEGRTARCACGKTRPSTDPGLAFFEYRGPGSPLATDGPDRYYCGHAGWD